MTAYTFARRIAGRVYRFFRRRYWPGHCTICERRTWFIAYGPYYRDQLICARCSSIPRERALMLVIQTLFPDWRELRIHESSPGSTGASAKLARECVHYVASHYIPGQEPGNGWNGATIQDLAAQTFGDASFDIVITQDVFEHLIEPGLAIREIARTLKPGGAHIMTVPIVNKSGPSERRARLMSGGIEYLKEPQYHDNPVDEAGSLVTVDWGYDIADYLAAHSGCPTIIHTHQDLSRGLGGEYIDVVVTRKGAVPRI